MSRFAIAIHGGAGTITRKLLSPEKEQEYKQALLAALDVAYNVLATGGIALDAVETATKMLEDCPLFNAGKGSVYTHEGKHEMDAAIMNGDDLKAGAVSLICNVRNPILLARAIMEKSEHVYLCGEGAEQFARLNNIAFEADEYFHDAYRLLQWQKVNGSNNTYLDHNLQNDAKKYGTVGAVALDMHGNLAAATSTGGMTNKRFGRIGDSPIIGAGTYANNNTCAVSCTGHGELFIRSVAAYDVSCLMEYSGLSLKAACDKVVMQKLMAIQGSGGLIAIDKNGNVELCFNSEGMYRAMRKSDGQELIAVFR